MLMIGYKKNLKPVNNSRIGTKMNIFYDTLLYNNVNIYLPTITVDGLVCINVVSKSPFSKVVYHCI